MKNQSTSLTCETDYFISEQMDEILVFTYKGNSLLASTMLKAKEITLAHFRRVEADPQVRIIVLNHTPEKPRREEYLAIYDMLASSRLSENSLMRMHHSVDQLIMRILSSDQFFISANCGEILPLMIGISLACDYRILGDNALIQNPSLELGLAPKGGSPYFLSRSLGKGKIYDLLLSDQDITAQEAVALGLADRLVPMATFDQDVLQIAQRFAALPQSSLSLAKRLINFSCSDIKSYLEYETKQILRSMHQKMMMGSDRI